MSALRPLATVYTCRNPGQTALLWAWQPAPFGHGWIEVKAEPLVRLSDVGVQLAEARALLTKCTQRFQKEMYGDPIVDRIGRFLNSQQVTK